MGSQLYKYINSIGRSLWKCLGFWNPGQFSTQDGFIPQPPQAFLEISVRLDHSIQTPGKCIYSLDHIKAFVQANVWNSSYLSRAGSVVGGVFGI